VLGLILAHGFFVAGEFGLVAVDRNRIEQRADAGDSRAAGVLKALRSLSFQLSGAQLGITVTSLIVGFLAEPTIGRALRPLLDGAGLSQRSALAVSIALALALATAAEMVVAELIPKNVAIAKPEPVALMVTGPLRAYNALFKPIILFLNASADWTVRLLRIEPREELIPVRSLEELRLLIHSSREGGALPEEEFSLLARSISFPEKTAADALTPRTSVAAINSSETVAATLELALTTGHSRFPIYGSDLDDIVGVVHVKDCYGVAGEEREQTSVARVMQEPLVVPESRGLDSLLMEMRRDRKQLAVVVDEYGGTAGIVTIEDLLEEIVGDIEDEYDRRSETPRLTEVPAGVHVLSGMLHPDEVREECGLELPDGPYETLAGFVLWLLDRIPGQGDHVSYEGWELKVVEMEGHRIAKVLLVSPTGAAHEEATP
jgi:CBS domain containing-hemolysin-like protein